MVTLLLRDLQFNPDFATRKRRRQVRRKLLKQLFDFDEVTPGLSPVLTKTRNSP